jgi:hypothetical protein
MRDGSLSMRTIFQGTSGSFYDIPSPPCGLSITNKYINLIISSCCPHSPLKEKVRVRRSGRICFYLPLEYPQEENV